LPASRTLAGLLAACAMLLTAPPAFAAKISVSYSLVYDRIRPEPQKGVTVTSNYEVTLGEDGKVSEDQTRASGRMSDNFQRKGSLGDSRWQVAGENQLKRTAEGEQHTLLMTITTTGTTCKLEVEYKLKEGFKEYKFRRIKDGTMAYFTQPTITTTRCAIRD
jgi:hypothetical protein